MTRTLPLLAATLACVALSASAEAMRPGRYKTVMTMGVPGMKPIQHEECVTQRDVDSGLARFSGDEATQCKASDIKRGPGTISYKVTCVEDGKKSSGEMNGRFAADSFDFNLVLTSPQPMKMNIKGTRTGECK